MRLLNPGAGEIVDRLTILALKILHSGQAKHFVDERNALLVQLRARTTMNGIWFEHALELGAINGTLWRAEDDIRRLRSQAELSGPAAVAKEAVTVAFRIQELNDRRAELIEQINKAVGDHLGSEKI